MRIEDHGFIGDTRTETGALVGRDGAVEWLCLPRDDSASCLASLVGAERADCPGARGEGQFLACSLWLVHARALNGRVGDARALFERLLALSNDLGLLAEEYDVERRRQVGSFPQAFSHLTLIGAASALAAAAQPDAGLAAQHTEMTT